MRLHKALSNPNCNSISFKASDARIQKYFIFRMLSFLRYSPERDAKKYSIREISDFLLGYDLRRRGGEMTSDDSILEIPWKYVKV